MAATGRPRKPDHLKLVAGNPGKRPLKSASKKGASRTRKKRPVAARPTSPPAHLTKHALAEWRRISKILFKKGLLEEADRAALASYCCHYGRWVFAEEKLEALGIESWVASTDKGFEHKSAWLQISNTAMEAMNKIGEMFGLAPVSRERMPEAPDDGKEKNPAEKFFT